MSGRSGFTLLEVLLAVSIASILLVTVYGVFSTAETSRRRVVARSEAYHLGRVIFDRLDRELLSLAVRNQPGAPAISAGRDDLGRPYLALLTQAGEGRDQGMRQVRYRLEETTDGERQLTRQSNPWPLPPELAGPQRLTDRVESFRLRFHNGTIWRDSWNSERDGRPKLVEVSLEIRAGDTRVPLHSIVRLPTEVRF